MIPSTNGLKKLVTIMGYALNNHVANLLGSAAVYSLPIIAARLLSYSSAAAFYLSFSISSAFYLIPFNAAVMLLPHATSERVHVSDRRRLQILLWVFMGSMVIIVPIVPLVLNVFGSAYVRSASVTLQILLLAAIPMTPANLYFSFLRLHRDDWAVIALTFIYSVVIGVAALSAPRFIGLPGVALAYLGGWGAVLLCAIVHALYKHNPLGWLWLDVGRVRPRESSS
jgi:O-antigen/teichoic acid export membrane protein